MKPGAGNVGVPTSRNTPLAKSSRFALKIFNKLFVTKRFKPGLLRRAERLSPEAPSHPPPAAGRAPARNGERRCQRRGGGGTRTLPRPRPPPRGLRRGAPTPEASATARGAAKRSLLSNRCSRVPPRLEEARRASGWPRRTCCARRRLGGRNGGPAPLGSQGRRQSIAFRLRPWRRESVRPTLLPSAPDAGRGPRPAWPAPPGRTRRAQAPGTDAKGRPPRV